MRPKVKVCGVGNRDSLRVCVEQGVSAVGFIFYDVSPRSVTPAQVKGWVHDLPPFIDAVGVFVGEKPEKISKLIDSCHLAHVQLHGKETPEECQDLPSDRVIKAFRVDKHFSERTVEPYVQSVAAVMLDSPAAGSTFDWMMARRIRDAFPELPMILAGGLNAANVGDAIAQVDPWAVDASSSLEDSPGVKNPDKISAFMRAVYHTQLARSAGH